MKDVTEAVLRFRETARHVWNAGLKEGRSWDVRDDFNEMCFALFRAMVLRGVGAADLMPTALSDAPPEPLRVLRVVPTDDTGTPILINRTFPSSGYWDDPVRNVKSDEVVLSFVRFWDWDDLGDREFAYIEVVIEAFPRYPELVRRSALLETQYARFLFDGPDKDTPSVR